MEQHTTPTVKISRKKGETKIRTRYRQAENEDITELLVGEKKGIIAKDGLDVITGRQRFLSLIFCCFPVWFGCPFVLVLSEDSIGFYIFILFSGQGGIE